MSSAASRAAILQRLRQAAVAFDDVERPDQFLPTTPLDDYSPTALRARFVHEAQLLQVVVHEVASEAAAVAAICEIVGDDERLLTWRLDKIGLGGLEAGLAAANITPIFEADASLRVGLTAVDAALATTGSLVLCSGAGKLRAASLLPQLHIAVVRAQQIVADLESWVAVQQADELAALRQASNVIIISGASRTADIAMELILGMHGPGELHVVLISFE